MTYEEKNEPKEPKLKKVIKREKINAKKLERQQKEKKQKLREKEKEKIRKESHSNKKNPPFITLLDPD